MLKIRFSFPYENFPILRQLPDDFSVVNGVEFYINPEKEEDFYDFYIVYNNINSTEEVINCNPKNTLLIIGEPPSIDTFDNRFVRQFNHVITVDKNLKHKNLHQSPLHLPWYINKDYNYLKSHSQARHKNKKISIFSSTKTMTTGHKKRLRFALKLKATFKDKVDLFGKGLQEINDKWDGLSSYEFSLAIENSIFKNYFTEKITDCFLSETVPLYYGCPNIDDYFHKESLIKIDIDDFSNTKKVIEKIIEDEISYDEFYPYLIESKERCLNNYNIFFFSEQFVKNKINLKNSNKKTKIYSRHHVPWTVNLKKILS